ncbi:MAG: hypothetical protein CMJ48_07815 [Planctomycetaceae bacterium]|nr:hypothetical protein [Planctomycetaceae bacterium]
MSRLSFLAVLLVAFPSLIGSDVRAADKTIRVDIRVDSEHAGYEGFRAMDGNPETMWHTDFATRQTDHPHQITIDLGKSYKIEGMEYLPRTGGGNGTIAKYECYVSDNKKNFGKPIAEGTFTKSAGQQTVKFASAATGRYVRVRALSEVAGRAWTSIAELRLLSPGVKFLAKTTGLFELVHEDGTPFDELEIQFSALQADLRNAAHFDRVAESTLNKQALVWKSDRDAVDVVLRRTSAALEDLQRMPSAPDLTGLAAELKQLDGKARTVDVEDEEARLTLFKQICAVRRKIVFSNPLLDFSEILFVKRHRATFNHMCDQYYGINAKPGGGVCVISDAFGESPQVRDILEGSVVKRGRLKGQRLEGGSFVAPDLSYDGKTVAFAYVECQGDTAHRHHTDPSRGHWHEQRCNHLFKANIDGTGLEQLTDGTWNDFDPCWLPNGRIAFITERRGGYLRCGRVCPTYTLFDMQDDGSRIRCLSYHETNEWHPSVTHDGQIIYTRWDYVDRHGCTAHMPWITTPDGRDSRAVHGNFAPRQTRPDMEVDVRAVPKSHKFVATAAPHHGQAFGSLVLVDPFIPDDDKMAPVKRITPDVGFPETQGGAQVYGTAWPLSETYYLCTYDATMRPGAGRQGRGYLRGDYGLYLIDAFGNKELIYRDPEISSQTPIPLQPRTKPPVAPETIAKQEQNQPYVAPDGQGGNSPGEATVSVIDVYDSLTKWPAGTDIKELRVIQILPMTVPSGRPPHEVGPRIAAAGDSVVLARRVLGTVPVEKDGSAHFTVPAQKEIFFQTLDARGMAVQSMRSATYLQKGERLVCNGCHEPRNGPRQISSHAAPLAMKRAPSRLKPDVEGSNPFSYARLVQPVLDQHCVECHAKNAKTAMNLAREPIQKKWFASYANLVPEYGFWNYGSGHRTTPGKFGARASKLFELLEKGHYDVKLPEEDLHRLTLWLDCCSVFYGVYEKEGGEAQLRGEVVYPTLE